MCVVAGGHKSQKKVKREPHARRTQLPSASPQLLPGPAGTSRWCWTTPGRAWLRAPLDDDVAQVHTTPARAPRRFLVVCAARKRCGARRGVPAARRGAGRRTHARRASGWRVCTGRGLRAVAPALGTAAPPGGGLDAAGAGLNPLWEAFAHCCQAGAASKWEWCDRVALPWQARSASTARRLKGAARVWSCLRRGAAILGSARRRGKA